MTFAYDSPSGNITLYLKVYKDLSAGYLVNDNIMKKELISEDITGFNFDKDIIHIIT